MLSFSLRSDHVFSYRARLQHIRDSMQNLLESWIGIEKHPDLSVSFWNMCITKERKNHFYIDWWYNQLNIYDKNMLYLVLYIYTQYANRSLVKITWKYLATEQPDLTPGKRPEGAVVPDTGDGDSISLFGHLLNLGNLCKARKNELRIRSCMISCMETFCDTLPFTASPGTLPKMSWKLLDLEHMPNCHKSSHGWNALQRAGQGWSKRSQVWS